MIELSSIVLASSNSILDLITRLAGLLVACVVTFVVVFWISLVVWTFRDVRSRTQDYPTQILATILVALFFICGLFIYMVLRPRQTLAESYEQHLAEESLLAEMTERQTCNNCHARVEGDFQICPSCGQKLKRPCPKCERLLELRWTFCPYCANNLNAAPMPGSMSGMQGMPGMPQGISMGGNPMGGNRY